MDAQTNPRIFLIQKLLEEQEYEDFVIPRKITKSTEDYLEQIKKLKEKLDAAEALVIGAGAGLSTSAGFTYSGERFHLYFSDFEEKYGIQDMYSGGFYPFDAPEEYWAYWSRYIWINRYQAPPKPVYEKLLELVKEKDYFVITTNVDHCFQKAGFDKQRLFYTQGDYGLFQCSQPCCQETFDNRELIKEMFEKQQDMRIPSELLPVCPHCGSPMTMNLRADDRFAEDAGWHLAAKRYERFLYEKNGQRIVFLELGVGYNTPVIIKYPFWRMTAEKKKATYACVNLGETHCPEEIRERSICINGDIGEIISQLQRL